MCKKSIEIAKISKHISDYLIYDLNTFQNGISEHPTIYFTGDLVRQSRFLATRIAKFGATKAPQEHKNITDSLTSLTRRLHRYCDQLEKVKSNGKDFVPLLRKELRKLKHIHHRWINRL